MVDDVSGPAQQAALSGLVLTHADYNGQSDLLDSAAFIADPQMLSRAIVVVPASSIAVAGQNNHSFEIGFFRPFSLGNRVWTDSNDNSLLDKNEVGFAGVSVEILTAERRSIDPDGWGPLTSTVIVTDASGHYRFDNLAPGEYCVRATAPYWAVSSTLDSTRPDDDVDATAVTASDNGIGIGSDALACGIHLGPLEPTGETDVAASGQGASGQFANMTVDFGFRPIPIVPVVFATTTTTTAPPVLSTTTSILPAPVTTVAPRCASIGDFVWSDIDRDGLHDNGEFGLADILVRLSRSGVVETEVRTGPGGMYRFECVAPGAVTVEVMDPRVVTNGPASRSVIVVSATDDWEIDFALAEESVVAGQLALTGSSSSSLAAVGVFWVGLGVALVLAGSGFRPVRRRPRRT